MEKKGKSDVSHLLAREETYRIDWAKRVRIHVEGIVISLSYNVVGIIIYFPSIMLEQLIVSMAF